MKRGTESRVFLGKDTSIDEFTGINVLSTVLLGKKEGGFKDHDGLFIASNVTLGKGIARVITVVVYGTSPLSLPNAIEADIVSLKAFGGTEQETETIIKTATAQGKTEQGNLPGGYTQLEYIESSGTQYIDIDVSGDATFIGTAQSTTDSPTTSQVLVANSGAGAGHWFGVQSPGAGSSFAKRWGLGATATASSTIDGTTKVDFEITFTQSSQYGTVNDQVLNRESSTSAHTNWVIFAGNTTPLYGFIGKVWELKVIQNNVLVRNLVPCKNASNVVGMYDLANDVFYQNAGTGTFAAGGEAVPTPNAQMDIVCNNGKLKFVDNGIPTGYKRLTGFSTNNDCYYQITNFRLTGADTIKFSFEFGGTACNVLGSYTTSSADDNLSLYIGTNTSAKYLRYDGGTASSYCQADTRYDVQITPTGSIGFETESTWTEKTFTCPVDFLICTTGITATSSKFIGTFYGNIEVVNRLMLIPVERQSDNMVCLYDSVSENIYEPIGTNPTLLGYDYSHYIVVADGTQETVTDALSNTSTCERLLQVGTYTDTQEILSGVVTRNVGIKVFDGTETGWVRGTNSIYIDGLFNDAIGYSADNPAIICSHFRCFPPSTTVSNMPDLSAKLGAPASPSRMYFVYDAMTTAAQFKQFLADQYAAGTPVIVVYPLATATTESVTGQNLRKEPLTVTGSLPNLLVNTTTTDAVPTPEYPLDIVCNNGALKWDSVNQTVYADGTVETINVHGTNLLDLANCTDGYYYSPTGEYGSVTSARLSNFIPVKAGVTYTVFAYGSKGSANVRVNLLDTQKNWLSQEVMATILGEYIAISVTPTQDGYLAFSANYISNSYIDWSLAQVVRGAYTVATMPEYQPYFDGGTATAEMLLKVGNYQDVQSVTDGVVTRNVVVKALDGTENWSSSSTPNIYLLNATDALRPSSPSRIAIPCTHFVGTNATNENMPNNSIKQGSFSTIPNNGGIAIKTSVANNLTNFKAWLADQYTAGTPVIIVYVLATQTTQSVTGQPMATTQGDNIAEITQASLDGLTLEVTYLAGATVTIQEVENAQLSDDVDVTIH